MIRRTTSRSELAGTTIQAWISQHHKIMSFAWQKLKTSLRSFNLRFTSCPRSSVSPFQAEASSRLSSIRNYTLVSLHTSERLFAAWLCLRPKKPRWRNEENGTVTVHALLRHVNLFKHNRSGRRSRRTLQLVWEVRHSFTIKVRNDACTQVALSPRFRGRRRLCAVSSCRTPPVRHAPMILERVSVVRASSTKFPSR